MNSYSFRDKIKSKLESIDNTEKKVEFLIKAKRLYLEQYISEYKELTIENIDNMERPFVQWCDDMIQKLEFKLLVENHVELYLFPKRRREIYDFNDIDELRNKYYQDIRFKEPYQEAVKSAPDKAIFIKMRILSVESMLESKTVIKNGLERKQNLLIECRRLGFERTYDRYTWDLEAFGMFLDHFYHGAFDLISHDERDIIDYLILKEIAYGSDIAVHINFLKNELLKIEQHGNNVSPIKVKAQEDHYKDLDELFYDKHFAIPCYGVLMEKELIDAKYNWLNKDKAAFCVWIRELKRGNNPFIRPCKDKVYTELLNKKFNGLGMDSSNFRRQNKRAEEKYKLEFKTLLSQVSQLELK